MQVNDIDSYFKSLLRIEKVENEKDDQVAFRSFPPHLNSATIHQPSRTYGGTTICYAFLAAKLLHRERPNSIFITFLSQGSCEIPIDTKVRKLDNDKMFVEVSQNGKTLSRAYVKKNAISDWTTLETNRRLIDGQVKAPEFYKIDDENSRKLQNIQSETAWKERKDVYSSPFDVRLVEYGSSDGCKEVSMIWVRLPVNQRRNINIKTISAEGLVMYISDYYIIQPASIFLRKHGRYFKAIVSLNHSVDIIQHDFDPFQWFLIHSTLESFIQDRAILRFVIYSENKQVIASGRQECYTPSCIHKL
ncbi:unnamed protein product [Caenorhabditis angaria]|uniref:Acyl-CoA thioesterase-like C-terminal domain-containing protein n=1 Tax=Caenorhabditis angaria TaxID=860376 RepID=A0A9P1IYA2_9PELO|nr:unnamed protein product [Caenorhabditis angaria]